MMSASFLHDRLKWNAFGNNHQQLFQFTSCGDIHISILRYVIFHSLVDYLVQLDFKSDIFAKRVIAVLYIFSE